MKMFPMGSLERSREALAAPASQVFRDSVPDMQRLLTTLQSLPASSVRLGHERAFADWLRPEDRAGLRTRTYDAKIRLDVGKPLEVFASRPPMEILVGKACSPGFVLTPESLTDIAALATGAVNLAIRSGRLFTTPDARGIQVEFVSPEAVPVLIQKICGLFNTRATGPSAVHGAVWLLVAVLNAHAFLDGNGRVARALANAYLIRNGALMHGPLPLGPLVYATGGNFEVAVRYVEIKNDWRPLARVMAEIVEVYAGLCDRFMTETAVPLRA